MLALAVAVLFGVVAGMLAAFYLAYLMKRVKGGKDLDLGALTGLLVFLVGGNGVAGPVTTYALAQPELWLWYGVSSFGTFILLSIFSVIQYIFRYYLLWRQADGDSRFLEGRGREDRRPDGGLWRASHTEAL